MNKDESCTLGGIVSGIGIAAAGASLVVATGGAALIAGSIGLGAAISGETNVIQQACSDKKEFDGADFITNVAIGGATGIISTGAGVAASGLASKFALEGGKKMATQAACQAIGGAISSTGGTVTQKIVNDEEIKLGDVGEAVLTGAVAGGAGAAIGGATNSIISKNVTDKAGKIATGVIGGAAGGTVTSGSVKIISNVSQDRDWDEGLGQAIATGAAIGSVSGGISSLRDIKMNSDSKP